LTEKAESIFIYGAGGHGRVVFDAIDRESRELKIFFLDDMARAGQRLLGVPVLDGSLNSTLPHGKINIAVGDNRARKLISGRFHPQKLLTIAHNNAVVSQHAFIGQGCFMAAGSVVAAGSELGLGVIVNHSAVLDHNCVVSAFCHIAPSATVCGGVKLGEGVLVGAGAVLLPGVTIGEWSVIGAGSVVTSDVSPNSVVVGAPAEIKTVRGQSNSKGIVGDFS